MKFEDSHCSLSTHSCWCPLWRICT